MSDGNYSQVTSPFGDIVHKKENVSMDQFAFTTAEAGNYLACFWVEGDDRGLVVKLNLDWKIGIAAKDWDSVAKKEKIEVKYMQMSNVVLCRYFIYFISLFIVFHFLH